MRTAVVNRILDTLEHRLLLALAIGDIVGIIGLGIQIRRMQNAGTR